MSIQQHTRGASYAAIHSANLAEYSNARTSEIEVLRSGYDVDGTKVELTYDPGRRRYSVATRWQYLVHFSVDFDTPKWRRIGVERAGAVFEAICMFSASKIVALLAKKHAMALDRAHFINSAGYEREVLRKTRNSLESTSAQASLLT